jgi:hypothetical protein
VCGPFGFPHAYYYHHPNHASNRITIHKVSTYNYLHNQHFWQASSMPWAFFRHVARTVTYTSNGVDHDDLICSDTARSQATIKRRLSSGRNNNLSGRRIHIRWRCWRGREAIVGSKDSYIGRLKPTWIARKSHIRSWRWLVEPRPQRSSFFSVLVLYYSPVHERNKTLHFFWKKGDF